MTWTPVDRDYETLGIDLQTLFKDLGITTTHRRPHRQHFVDRDLASFYRRLDPGTWPAGARPIPVVLRGGQGNQGILRPAATAAAEPRMASRVPAIVQGRVMSCWVVS